MRDNGLRHCTNEDGALSETKSICIRFHDKVGYFHTIWIEDTDELWDTLIQLQDKCLSDELAMEAETQ